jgi:hypothetical protein
MGFIDILFIGISATTFSLLVLFVLLFLLQNPKDELFGSTGFLNPTLVPYLFLGFVAFFIYSIIITVLRIFIIDRIITSFLAQLLNSSVIRLFLLLFDVLVQESLKLAPVYSYWKAHNSNRHPGFKDYFYPLYFAGFFIGVSFGIGEVWGLLLLIPDANVSLIWWFSHERMFIVNLHGMFTYLMVYGFFQNKTFLILALFAHFWVNYVIELYNSAVIPIVVVWLDLYIVFIILAVFFIFTGKVQEIHYPKNIFSKREAP